MKSSRRVFLGIAACVVILAGGFWLHRFGRDTNYIRTLGDSDTRRRWKAIGYLAKHKVSRGVLPLISIMKDEKSTATAMLATQALGQIGTREAVDALVAEVEAESPLAATATFGLFLAGDERAMPTLMVALASRNEELKQGAALALSKFDRKECIPGLVEVLERSNSSIDDPKMHIPRNATNVIPGARRVASSVIASKKWCADYCASKLRQLTGQSFAYEVNESKENRAKAVEAWKTWVTD